MSERTSGSEPVDVFRLEEERLPGDVVVISIQGELDLYVAGDLRDRLADVSDTRPSRLVLDLSGVTFVDSMGLGVLLGASKRVRAEGGELRIAGPNDDLRRLFEITLLDRVFEIDASRADALAAGSS